MTLLYGSRDSLERARRNGAAKMDRGLEAKIKESLHSGPLSIQAIHAATEINYSTVYRKLKEMAGKGDLVCLGRQLGEGMAKIYGLPGQRLPDLRKPAPKPRAKSCCGSGVIAPPAHCTGFRWFNSKW